MVLGAHTPLQAEDTQVVVTTSDYVAHEKYDVITIVNDIALVKLGKNVELNDYIQVVSLPTNNDDLYINSTGRVSGWGLTTNDTHSIDISPVLKYADLTIISNEECKDIFGTALGFYVRDNNVCTFGGDDYITPCKGDSGGPLTLNGEIIGIASFAEYYCSAGFPTGYTRVAFYLDWIQQNLSL